MEVSQLLGRTAIRIGKASKAAEDGIVSGDFVLDILKEGLSSFNEVSLPDPPVESPSLDESLESLQVFSMICEYLIDKGAISTVHSLLQEMNTCPLTDEKSTPYTVYNIYSPWKKELSLPMEKILYRNTGSQEELSLTRDRCISYLKKREEFSAGTSSYMNIICSLVKDYIEKKDNGLSFPNRVKELQNLVEEIRKYFYFEGNSLICSGVKYTKEISTAISLSSKEYRDILFSLSLIISPLRRSEVERLYKESFLAPPSQKGISIDIFYSVGKKMEEININPYDIESEPIESAVPPILSFHSSFFCPVLRTECSIDNLPCILLCGHVICTRALEKIALFKGSPFKCPYCPKDVHLKDVFRLKLPI